MEKEYIEGVSKITRHINDEVISRSPKKVREKTVRRELKSYECGSGGLICEERQNDKEPFRIDQSSLDNLSDPCDTFSEEEIAKYCTMSVRWVKDKKHK